MKRVEATGMDETSKEEIVDKKREREPQIRFREYVHLEDQLNKIKEENWKRKIREMGRESGVVDVARNCERISN